MEGDSSPMSSMCMVRAEELYPKIAMVKEDERIKAPMTELAGESVKYIGHTEDGLLAVSNYRVYLYKTVSGAEVSVPLGLIESATLRDPFNLLLNCKDASTVKCAFKTPEQCAEWQRRISLHVGVPSSLETLFAFPFHAWTAEKIPDSEWADRLQRSHHSNDDFMSEIVRLGYNTRGEWRVSYVNQDFKLCVSYPRLLLVPSCITDDLLQNIATFRSSRRIPVIVWRHKGNGAVMARCSQPEVGWLGWRNANDEMMFKAMVDACASDAGDQADRSTPMSNGTTGSNSSSNGSDKTEPDGCVEVPSNKEPPKKLLIIDARSYASAVTNRARGGGCEHPDYYMCVDIEFMNLGNIHTIRKSFHQLRQLCANPPDNQSWLSSLEKSLWLQHLSSLLAASINVCHAMERAGRPVLVHCSDGWDRTPQILATSQLCMDPYYRTVEGFRVLVEREWLSFGHKFADRCGHGPNSDEPNERCPVFLQWLDAIYQIHRQFPCGFEFSMGYLIKLAQHSHSCIFGTFLCNSLKDRCENFIFDRTFSVWAFLSSPIYKNPLYIPNRERVLWPAHHVRDLVVWKEVYLGSLGSFTDYPPDSNEMLLETKNSLTKTRSYGDLIAAGGPNGGLTRRSSDPNMSVESHNSSFGVIKHPESDASDNSIINVSVDNAAIAHYASDSSRELDNMTKELNQVGPMLAPPMLPSSCNGHPNNINESQKSDSKLSYATSRRLYADESNSAVAADNTDMVTQMAEELQNHRNPAESIDMVDGRDVVVDGSCGNGCGGSEGNVHFAYDSSDMLQSVNLNDCRVESPTIEESDQNMWHGNVQTSTDTLVPIESVANSSHPVEIARGARMRFDSDTLEHNFTNHLMMASSSPARPQSYMTEASVVNVSDESVISANDSSYPDANDRTLTACSPVLLNTPPRILPQVHTNGIGRKNFILGTTTTTTTTTTHIMSNGGNHVPPPPPPPPPPLLLPPNPMEESILIQPEFQRMEISNNGHVGGTTASHIINTTSSHRRRRNSANSRPNGVAGIGVNASFALNNGSISPTATNSRSLPLSPVPAHLERPGYAISCPDGLAHALSEQNLRLQQIVYEHKVREEALQRELYHTRLALQNRPASQNLPQDDTTGLIDNVENASVCSWEAVEEQRGTSTSIGSGSSSANLSGSVLWVPDHAVSQCTSCQTEFWLGRRKHHCRSCGQIFCADCSEFWAALPDERLYQPVRLCGPCYHSVTTKTQQQHFRNIQVELAASQQHQPLTSQFQAPPPSQNYHPNNTSNEPCKQAAGPSPNDCRPLKATTATN